MTVVPMKIGIQNSAYRCKIKNNKAPLKAELCYLCKNMYGKFADFGQFYIIYEISFYKFRI